MGLVTMHIALLIAALVTFIVGAILDSPRWIGAGLALLTIVLWLAPSLH